MELAVQPTHSGDPFSQGLSLVNYQSQSRLVVDRFGPF